MAKAVPDIVDPAEKEAGFASGDSDITGFSHMHDSGTGGARTHPMRCQKISNCFLRHPHLGISLSSPRADVPKIA